MENRNGLLVDFQIVEANGTAERRTAIEMMDQNLPGTSRITVGADKAYDTTDYVTTCRALKVTPHLAANDRRPGGSALDGPHDAPLESAKAQAGRGDLWLDQDYRQLPAHPLSGPRTHAVGGLPGGRRIHNLMRIARLSAVAA